MPFKHKLNSTHRRYRLSNRISFLDLPVIRLYDFCVLRQVLYIIFSDSEHYFTYIRVNRFCELIPLYQKIKRLNKVKDKLIQKIIETEVKLLRLRKQRRLLQQKRRILSARELQNVEELEIDEIMIEGMEIFKKNR
jgi:hypothetical protein